MKKRRLKIISGIIAVTMIFSIGVIPASANPSNYWCSTHQRAGCTHCASHSVITVANNSTATCITGGGQVRQCTTSGCGSTFYQTPPIAHVYTNNICLVTAGCGRVNTSNANHFRHYMYRRGASSPSGKFANHISDDYGTGHEAIDIIIADWWWCSVQNRNIGYIRGVPIIAQGVGTVTDRSGASQHPTMGFWIQITYTINNTAHRTRYLHMLNSPNPALTTQVSASTQLGLTGDTGSPNNNHLHFDVTLPSGSRTNPKNMFPSGTFS
jgi:hypothetical protein